MKNDMESNESTLTKSSIFVAHSAANASGNSHCETRPIGQASGTNISPPTFFSRYGRRNPLLATAWPFGDDEILEPATALEIVTSPLLGENPGHAHFTKENTAIGPSHSGDDCCKHQPSATTNILSCRQDSPKKEQKEPLVEFGKPALPSANKGFTFESPSSPIKNDPDFGIRETTAEPASKKVKLRKATVPAVTSDNSAIAKSASTSTKGKMDRRDQARAGRLKIPAEQLQTEKADQRPAQKVKTETNDHEMEDVTYDVPSQSPVQSPSIPDINKKSFALNQVSSEENPASAYASLKRVGKRSHKAVDPDVAQNQAQGQGEDNQDPEQRRNSRRTERPYAPPSYPRNSAKPKGSRRTELQQRKTHYGAEIYRQFDQMPEVTQNYSRSDEEILKAMKPLVKKCLDAIKHGENTVELFAELRDRLHRMQTVYDFLSKHLIQYTRLLEEDSLGALLLPKNNNRFPWDIQGDAQMVAKHFFEYGCDPYLLRGIKMTTPEDKKGVSYSFDENYLRTPCNYVGAGKLINGQWWPRRICALRDGAHGTTEGGIHGATGKGAFSIVVGGDSGYQDFDHGDCIQYCGTSSDKNDGYGNSIPTANTNRLLESCDSVYNPVRVFRAAASSGKYTAYSPSCGLRFDGMYEITAKEHLDVNTSMYRFTLVRVAGQDPIRYTGPEARPTKYEKRACEELTVR
ncbi:MAG: hypothetical protein Q9169_004664 [Polycauliona sp. 2 TL-2023]